MKLTYLYAAVGAVLLVEQIAIGQSTFTRITAGLPRSGGIPFIRIGAHYDNDGFLDLSVANGTVLEGQSKMNNFQEL